jgi:3-methyladenine DNA glycosylase Tag
MNAVILTSDQYNQIITKIDSLASILSSKQRNPKDVFVDNQEFIQLMNISKRTSQTWRDEGKIAFSQVGGKIYYRMSDIQGLLDQNYRATF